MFDKSWKEESEKFDRQFKKTMNFAIGWFIFVALLSLSLLGGAIFIVVKLLINSGIL
jgi:uncharacterized Tic20 family protein